MNGGWLIDNMLAGAALAAITGLACRAFPIHPALRHVLWLLVLLKLVFPPIIRSPATRVFELDAARVTELVQTGFHAARPEASPSIPLAGPYGDRDLPVPWLITLWLSGSGLLLAQTIVRHRRLLATLSGTTPAPADVRDRVVRLANRIEIKSPRTLVLPAAEIPFVTGILRPTLVLPQRLLEHASPVALDAVLIHELAHLRRRDLWVGYIELFVGAAVWWNPVAWIARREMRFASELACDQWIAALVPESRAPYARLLVACAESVGPVQAATRALGQRTESSRFRDLRERIENLWRSNPKPGVGRRTTILVAAMALLVLPAWEKGVPEDSRWSIGDSATVGFLARGSVLFDPRARSFELRSRGSWVVVFERSADGPTAWLQVVWEDSSRSIRTFTIGGESRSDQEASRWLATVARRIDWDGLVDPDVVNPRSYAIVPRGSHAHRVDGEETLAAWTERGRLFLAHQGSPSEPLRVLEAALSDGSWQVESYAEDGLPAAFASRQRIWLEKILNRLATDDRFGPRLPQP